MAARSLKSMSRGGFGRQLGQGVESTEPPSGFASGPLVPRAGKEGGPGAKKEILLGHSARYLG